MADPAPPSSTSGRRLSVPVMLAYGAGDFVQAAIMVGIPSLLLFYYQQIVGLSGSLTGLAIGISLIFDALTDPLVGGLSDRLKGRFGRRHPLMALAPIPLAISLVLLFSPPEGLSNLWNFIWLTGFAILVRTWMTFFTVPQLALGAEMASDYDQRSTLFAVKMLVLGLAAAAIGMSVYWLFFPTTEQFDPGLLNPAGYQGFAWSAGFVIILGVMICVLGTAGEIPHLRSSEVTTRLSLLNLWRDMHEIFRDRDFFVIFLGFLFFYLFQFIEQAGLPFMAVHFWGLRTEQVAYGSVVLLAAIPVSFMLVPVLTRAIDKKWTLISGCMTAVIAPNILICLRLLDVSWYPENGSPWVLINYLSIMWIGTVGGWLSYSVYSSIFADVADSHELRTGKRREGAIYSTQTFSNKAASAFGIVIGGAILDWIAFPQNAGQGTVPEDVIWNLGFFVGPGTSIFTFSATLLFFLYRIDRGRHAEIMRQLADRKEREQNSRKLPEVS